MIGPDDLLDLAAFDLASIRSEASARRAVSAAYYALFHAFAQAGAKLVTAPADVQARLVRSYDHGAMRSMADEVERRARAKESVDPRLVLVARTLKVLRETREVADYDLAATLSWDLAAVSVAKAIEAVALLRQVESDPATAEYLLMPLLRDRNRRG